MSGALADLLADALARPGLGVEDGDGSVEGAVLDASALALASEIADAGARPDEPVLLAIHDRAPDLAALLGIWRAGCVAVPFHHGAPQPVRDRLRTRTGARLLIEGREPEIVAADPPPHRDLLDGAALVLFTSGTTGLPKGVVLGHERFREKLRVLDPLLAFRPDDVIALPLRLTFVYGLWVALLALHAGARLRIAPHGRDLPDVLDDATVLASVPTALRALLAKGAAAPKLRTIVSGGEHLGAGLAGATARAWPAAGLVDLYGLTETGACDFALGPDDRPEGDGSIGRPTDGVAFRIAGGPEGELQIQSPFGMLGYLDEPELTAAAFEGGFFQTGDLAKVRPDGRVAIIGRLKEIIVRSGIKIAPLELEALFEGHPDVAAALCAGLPDPKRGEAVHLALRARPGRALDPPELRDWALGRIERSKLPDVIHVMDELPVGPTGKADRGALIRLLAGGQSAASRSAAVSTSIGT